MVAPSARSRKRAADLVVRVEAVCLGRGRGACSLEYAIMERAQECLEIRAGVWRETEL